MESEDKALENGSRAESESQNDPKCPTLLIIESTGEKRRIPLDKKQIVIGRKQCDIQFDDQKVSGKHAMVEKEGNDYFIVDLNSTNGTYVNGSKIKRLKLVDQDMIQIGFTQLCFLKTSTPTIGLSTQVSDNSTSDLRAALSQTPQVSIDIDVTGVTNEVRHYTFLERNILIGRDSSHLTLEDETVSEKHALIQRLGSDRVFVIDLNTQGGTLLNGQRVNSARLKNGDRLKIGNQEITVTIVR